MKPSLNHGDRVLAIRCWFPQFLRRGQVVVMTFDNPPPFTDQVIALGLVHIKRIIGLPGDRITSSIDEIAQEFRTEILDIYNIEGEKVWEIPSKHIFVRGDNLRKSYDSVLYGPIPYRTVSYIAIKVIATGRLQKSYAKAHARASNSPNR